MKKSVVHVLALLLVVALTPSLGLANDLRNKIMGIGFFMGEQIPEGSVWVTEKKIDWTYASVNLTYGWQLSNRWQVNLEGSIGQFYFKDERGNRENVLALGLTAHVNYDVLQFDNWAAFLDLGAGPSYWSKTPKQNMVDRDGFPVIIQYGAGLKINFLKDLYLQAGYEFIHFSSLCNDDSGANSHGGTIKFIKRF